MGMNAVIFPGQGAQYAGMGKDLYESFPQAKDIFSQIDEILGYKLSQKCFEGAQSDLKDTALQQLAILAVSAVLYEVFKDKGIEIKYLSGLSLGEYSALYAAQVLSLRDLVILVRERALAMQRASQLNLSTMFAVMGVEKDVLLEKSKDNFYIANINSPQQIVISLKKEAVDKVKGILESIGAKVIELQVSGGFHSPFMKPAKKHLESVMRDLEFKDAKFPVVSNFTAQAHINSQEIKNNLINQLVSPVLWKDCVEYMVDRGVKVFFEVGPSRVLKGLIRKINPQLKVVNIEKKEDLDSV